MLPASMIERPEVDASGQTEVSPLGPYNGHYYVIDPDGTGKYIGRMQRLKKGAWRGIVYVKPISSDDIIKGKAEKAKVLKTLVRRTRLTCRQGVESHFKYREA